MKILIFGSAGLVGSSLVSNLPNIITDCKIFPSSRKDTNLFSASETLKKINSTNPDVVINAAAKVGGIHANNIKEQNLFWIILK